MPSFRDRQPVYNGLTMTEPGQQTPETSRIELPDAPQIDGLIFRRSRGATDQQLLVALAARCAAKDPFAIDSGQDLLAGRRDDLEQPNAIFAEVRGELVAYGRASWRLTYSGERIYRHMVQVRPDWRGRGIGAALTSYLQNILLEIAGGHSGEPAAHLETEAAGDDPLTGQLIAQGYSPVRRFWRMERLHLEDIPEVLLPEGIETRPPRPEEVSRVLDGLVEAMRDHWGAGIPPDEGIAEFLQAVYCQPHLWVVGWDQDEVAGMVLNWIPTEWNERTGRKVGLTDPIAVRRPWRRRGLARALLARSLGLLKEQGMQAAAVTVDSEHPSGAPAMLSALGFQPVDEWLVYRKRLREDEGRIE